jgi:hypothetical protein
VALGRMSILYRKGGRRVAKGAYMQVHGMRQTEWCVGVVFNKPVCPLYTLSASLIMAHSVEEKD